MESIATDILVIGGGGAGSRAALTAKISNPNLKVMLATAGKYGFSGSTNFFASETLGINAPFNYEDDGDNPEIYKNDMLETGLGLANEELCEIISKEASLRVNDLIDLGIKFDSYDNGKIRQCRLSGCTKARSMSVNGKTGFEIVKVLKNANYRQGVNIIENCKLIDLVAFDGAVHGGMFNTMDKLIFIKAQAVIITTGGAGGAYDHNINPANSFGYYGYVSALKAGAKIINIEFIQIGPGVVYPGKKFIIHSYIWSFSPRLLNKKNEEFLQKYLPDNLKVGDVLRAKRFSYPFSCRTIAKYLDIAIFNEIMCGNGTGKGGIFLDITKVPIKELKSKAYVIYDTFKKIGFDISSQLLEIAPMVQSFNGGIKINENGETGVLGLFAAGEASGGVHGADRPGGNNLIDCQVFGYRAGASASNFISGGKANSHKKSNNRFVDLKVKEIEKIIVSNNGSENVETSNNLGKLFSRYLSVVRNKDGLNNVLNITEDIIRKKANGSINTTSDLYNTAMIGNLIARSALLRQESRGVHYREDFPDESSGLDKGIIACLEEDEIKTKFERN
ncbi:MAG: FAD-binding protein [Actinobacteria bacterium]|nr:FAD-binding protein [Actinomycetota bacterium]